MSETVVSYDFEQLEPSAPPPRDAAARLLAEARAQAEEIREQARAAGYEEGRAEGLREGAALTASAASALGEALRELESMREEVAEAVERDAIDLGLALAGKIVPATLQIRPGLVVEVVQGALRRVSGQRTIVLVVNPADIETVRSALGDLQAQGGVIDHWDLQADQRVAPGGAIVRTDEGEIDARLQTQLERAGEVVLAELGPRKRSK
ncbi:MAG: FliH/SctL family protein [Solirubrobacteraceae bacterium]